MNARLAIAAGLGTAMYTVAASAAPQMLGVVASSQPIPLTCEDGQCQADLTAFCLQRERPVPDYGTIYRSASPDAFTIVTKDSAGRETRLPAMGLVEYIAERGYTAVTVRLRQDRLRKLGAVNAAIEVSAEATLVPLPVPGDPDPLTAAEIAQAAGPLRRLGTRVVDRGGEKADAARLTSRLINALPLTGRVGEDRRTGLWDQVIGSSEEVGREAFDRCLASVADGHIFSLRGCLVRQHDSLMGDLTLRYWKAGFGS